MSSALFTTPVWAAETGASEFVSVTVLLAAGALALAAGLWALAERQQARALARAMRQDASRARGLLASREALLDAGREGLLVWPPNSGEPSNFGNGAQLLEACLTGPDAQDLSAALDELRQAGIGFSLSCRTATGETISVGGKPAGGQVAVYLEPAAAPGVRSAELLDTLNALPIPVWLRGSDLSLRFVNRAFLAATGTGEAEALAAGVAFDRSERDLASGVTESSAPSEAERFAIYKGRRQALAFTHATLSDGSVLGAALPAGNTAEGEALQKRHATVQREILDRLKTSVAIFGPDQKLDFRNRAFTELMGTPGPWLDSSPSLGEILDRLRDLRRLPEQPDFRAWKQLQLQQFESPQDRSEDWHMPGGQTLRVVTQVHPQGGLIFLFEDVSDHFRLEMSFNRLTKVQKASLDNLQEGVAVFGPDGRLKLHNTAFLRIWRLEEHELAGLPHLKRITQICTARFPGDRAWDLVTAAVTASQDARKLGGNDVERADGSIVALSIVPLPDGATLTSFVDITDRLRIETALRERNEALEESDHLKSEFVKRMSYELRTPLNSIVGFAEMLKTGTAGALNERQSEYADAVVKASNTLRDLINDVLDLSQIEAGGMELELEKVDLHLLLLGMAEHTREWAAKIGLTLQLDCPTEGGPFIADARRLKQVLFNLISNAFKYTPRGGIVVLGGEIHAEHVQIYVADTGPGVPPEIMASAFERFSARSGTVARAGAGLGLALVNRFIELHDGWVELESQPGKGTRVTCHLPRTLEHKQNAPNNAKRHA